MPDEEQLQQPGASRLGTRTRPGAPGRAAGSAGARGPGIVLVLGGRLPALTAARALAASGYRVVAGNGGEFSTVRYSRSCHEEWSHPPPRERAAFASAVSQFLARRPDCSIVLPVGEELAKAVAAISRQLPRPVRVAAPSPHAVTTCTDKDVMYRLATEAGVPHAPVRGARDLAAVSAAAEELGFPCIIKPATWAAPLPEGRKALICPDQASLERALDGWPTGHTTLLVQRYLSGPRHNLHFIARGGSIIACMQSETLRSDRADGTGVSVEAASVPLDRRLVRQCEALIGRLEYTGVGLYQAILADGAPHFLEIKPFLGSGYAFAEACGLELTRAAVDLAASPERWRAGIDVRYPIGRRYAWTSRDLYGMITARGRGEISGRPMLRWLARTLWAGLTADAHATWQWRDPMPTLATYGHLATLPRKARRQRDRRT